MCQKYGFSLTRIFPYKFTGFCYIKNYFSNTSYYTTAALLSITISTGASMSAFGQNRFYFLSFTTNELKVVLVVDIFTQIFHCFFKLRKRTLSMQDARGFESFSNFSKKKTKKKIVAQGIIDLNISWPSNFFEKTFMPKDLCACVFKVTRLAYLKLAFTYWFFYDLLILIKYAKFDI